MIFFLLTFLSISICCTGMAYAETQNSTSELNTDQTSIQTYDQEFYTNTTSDGVNYQLTEQSPGFSNIHGYFVNCGVTSPDNLNTTSLINQGITDLFVLTYRDDPEGSLEPFLDKFAGTGIRVHAWVSAFKDFDGNFFYPEDNPELLDQIITAITFIATNYNIDGINLDYIRYPGNAYLHPGAVDYVNSFCETIYNNIQAINNQQIPGKPYIQLSADLMPECSVNAYYYGQDYPGMSNYLDFLVPMVYKGNYHQDTSWIGRVMDYIVAHSNDKPVVAALQTYRSDWDYTRLPVDEMVLDIETAIDHGSCGYALFRYGMVTSDFPGNSIQNLIDISAPGDTVVIHEINGNPTIYNENIMVDKSIILKSADGEDITITALNPDLPAINITSDALRCTVQGFTINGSSNSFGIHINTVINCNITDNTISGNLIGLYIQNSNNIIVSLNNINNNGWVGVCLDNSYSNIINSNNISGNVEGLYIVNTSTENTISGNQIHDNFNAGINILNNSTNNIISDNTSISYNGVIGVLIRDSSGNIVSGNNIQDNGWAGIALDNTAGNTINGSNIITGNQEGLNITSSTGNTINGNTITGNDNIGISIINNSPENIISSNNAISNNGIIGIYLRDSASNTISNNIIQLNGWVGICMDHATGNSINGSNNLSGNLEGLYLVNNSDRNTITANTIMGNLDTGIYLENSTLNNIISNTTISGNGVIGILLRNADSNTINGNFLASNNFAGIALDNSDSNLINGLNIISSSQMGIYVVNDSDGNTINYNNLQNNTWAGLVLDTATNTTVYLNNFTNNPMQAIAQNGTGNAFYVVNSGNYWSEWSSTDPRPIDGNEGLYDEHPSITPF